MLRNIYSQDGLLVSKISLPPPISSYLLHVLRPDVASEQVVVYETLCHNQQVYLQNQSTFCYNSPKYSPGINVILVRMRLLVIDGWHY